MLTPNLPKRLAQFQANLVVGREPGLVRIAARIVECSQRRAVWKSTLQRHGSKRVEEMARDNPRSAHIAQLCGRAEALLQSKSCDISGFSPEDLSKLLHDLSTYESVVYLQRGSG